MEPVNDPQSLFLVTVRDPKRGWGVRGSLTLVLRDMSLPIATSLYCTQISHMSIQLRLNLTRKYLKAHSDMEPNYNTTTVMPQLIII